MKRESGFTILEIIMVMAMIVILIGLTYISLRPYTERNKALQVRSEAQLALDTSSGYLLSTSNYRRNTMVKQIQKVLNGYSEDSASDHRLLINETTDPYGDLNISIQLIVIVNTNLSITAYIDPQNESIFLEGNGDADSIESLKDSGVLDS